MRRVSLVASMTLVLVVLVACGGPSVSDEVAEKVAEKVAEQAYGGQVDIEQGDNDDFTLTVEDDDGSSMQIGGGGLPDDFPFPLPDEYTVGMNVRSEGPSGVEFLAVIQVPGVGIDELADMYASWLESEGFEVDRSDIQGSEGTELVFIAAQRPSDGTTANVDLSIEEIANDDDGNLVYATVVSFGWTPAGG